MDRFKEVLQRRLIALSTYTSGLVVLAAIGLYRPTAGETEEISAFMTGLNVGLFAAVMIVMAITSLKYIAALKDDEKRKALYIHETDERRLYIKSKMGGDAIQWILCGLVAATLVSEFFDQTVFFTLLCALVFTAAVKAAFKIVYTKKVS
ncbi:MAG: hypothetical protein JW811_01965 [Clostridiales bacterium]|nr:hypothetical protein [Clostridiales bacterium]